MSSVWKDESVQDGLKLLVAGVAAVVGVVLFVQRVYFELSVTGRAASFLATTLLCLVATATWNWKAGPGLVGMVALVLFLGYVAMTHEPTENTGAAALLAVFFVGFLVLTYLIQERRVALTTRGGAIAAVVVLALLSGAVAVDFQDRDVTYEVDAADRIDPEAGEQPREVDVGTVTFRNDGQLRERVSLDGTACIYTGDADVVRQGVSLGGLTVLEHHSVGRQSSATFDLKVVLDPDQMRAFGPGTVEVASSCPESSDGPRVVVAIEDATGDPAGA